MQFVWNEIDFLEYLAVVPSIIPADPLCCEPARYSYALHQPPLWLRLSVTDPDGDIYISVLCAPHANAIIEVELHSCPLARVVNDERGNYIEFAAAPGNCRSHRRHDLDAIIPYGVRLLVRPHIRVELKPIGDDYPGITPDL